MCSGWDFQKSQGMSSRTVLCPWPLALPVHPQLRPPAPGSWPDQEGAQEPRTLLLLRYSQVVVTVTERRKTHSSSRVTRVLGNHVSFLSPQICLFGILPVRESCNMWSSVIGFFHLAKLAPSSLFCFIAKYCSILCTYILFIH